MNADAAISSDSSSTQGSAPTDSKDSPGAQGQEERRGDHTPSPSNGTLRTILRRDSSMQESSVTPVRKKRVSFAGSAKEVRLVSGK